MLCGATKSSQPRTNAGLKRASASDITPQSCYAGAFALRVPPSALPFPLRSSGILHSYARCGSGLYCCDPLWCGLCCCDTLWCGLYCCDTLWCELYCCNTLWCGVAKVDGALCRRAMCDALSEAVALYSGQCSACLSPTYCRPRARAVIPGERMIRQTLPYIMSADTPNDGAPASDSCRSPLPRRAFLCSHMYSSRVCGRTAFNACLGALPFRGVPHVTLNYWAYRDTQQTQPLLQPSSRSCILRCQVQQRWWAALD